MYLAKLRIANFRCLESIDLAPANGVNLIVGENASGKSSLLEAIYFLGRARSFRRAAPGRLLRRGAEQLSVFAKLDDAASRSVGIKHEARQTRMKVDDKVDAAKYDLVSALPVQLIDPGLHRLLEEGPVERRRYLDWGVFHVEHEFFAAWRRYRRILRQRNQALRHGASRNAVTAWDAELVRCAEVLDRCRRAYIDKLQQILPPMVGAVLGDRDLQLEYHPGWPHSKPFRQALFDSLASDQRAGFTGVGPHRADLKIRLASQQARDWVSRGQQKVLSASLLVAQATLHAEHASTDPILLIDDIAAELGSHYRGELIRLIERQGLQCFITFLDSAHIPAVSSSACMFHVEHGHIRASS